MREGRLEGKLTLWTGMTLCTACAAFATLVEDILISACNDRSQLTGCGGKEA